MHDIAVDGQVLKGLSGPVVWSLNASENLQLENSLGGLELGLGDVGGEGLELSSGEVEQILGLWGSLEVSFERKKNKFMNFLLWFSEKKEKDSLGRGVVEGLPGWLVLQV